MAIECTDPKRWGKVPGFDADEQTVERYLAHLEECEYHARLENRADDRLASAAGVARANVRGSAIVLPGPLAERIHQERATRLDELHAALIRDLSIRVDGVEVARATAAGNSSTDVEAPEGSVVSVWGTGTGSTVFLSSCVVTGKRRESTTHLAGGQTISFQLAPRSSAPARVSVAFAPAVVTTAQTATRAGALERLSAFLSIKGGQWAPVYGLAAASLAIVVVAPIYLLLPDADPPAIIRGADPPLAPLPSGGEPANPPPDEPNELPVVTPPPPQSSERPKPPQRPALARSISDVRRLYIPPDEGTEELRAAITTRLRANGRFRLVRDEDQADAILRLSPMRGIEQKVAVWLDNRKQHQIWSTEDIVVSGENGTDGAAETLVEKLVNAAQPPAPVEPDSSEPTRTDPSAPADPDRAEPDQTDAAAPERS